MPCNTGTLSEYNPNTQNPWNKQKVQHLYRRLGFNANIAQIDNALNQNPSALIGSLFTNTINVGVYPAPSWENMTYSDYANPDDEIPVQHTELYHSFINDMRYQEGRGRFSLFWSNHFVTRLEDYWCPSWMYNYYKTIQQYAFGNFKEFVRTIGISPAMLVFLNGFENTADEPNENYARELYELFTLGVNNGYTQNDITETARALTGYVSNTDFCAPITFNSTYFDGGSKTIFGQTGNWGYNDVVDILFQERANEIANYICEKIYQYFVSPEIDYNITVELANTFIANNFELLPVYLQLFKSEHFFNAEAIGTIISSPYDNFINFTNATGLPIDPPLIDSLIWFNGEIGQEIFNPIDVAGWQGNHDWINSSTLVGRWTLYEWYLWDLYDITPEELRNFAVTLTNNNNDPAIITQQIVDHLIPKGLQNATDYNTATDVFKDEVPQNYYDNGTWNLQWTDAPYQVLVLLIHISKLPEFQLK